MLVMWYKFPSYLYSCNKFFSYVLLSQGITPPSRSMFVVGQRPNAAKAAAPNADHIDGPSSLDAPLVARDGQNIYNRMADVQLCSTSFMG
jgi:hypothetical protein